MSPKVIYKAKVQIGTKIPPGTLFERNKYGYNPVGIYIEGFSHDTVENSPDIFEKVIERESGKWYVGQLIGEGHRRAVFYTGISFSSFDESDFSYLSTEPIDLDKY